MATSIEKREKRIAELSKGYTKAELINMIIGREELISNHSEEIRKQAAEIKRLNSEGITKATTEVHNKYYKNWVEQNDAFLKRYIDSYLKHSLKIKVDGDFGNSITVSLLVNNQEVSEGTGYAICGSNPLDG